MKKRILSILLTLCMLFCLVPTTAFAEGETNRKVETEQELVDALADSSVDIITLKNDIAIGTTLTVLRKVTLDLNGYVLRYADTTANGSVFKIVSGGDLTVIDSRPDAEHRFNSDNILWAPDEQNGKEIVMGGVITGGTGTPCYVNGSSYFVACGGGVYLEGDARFTMDGGNIVGCIANTGGGVHISENGSFTMNGGSIMGCSSWDLSVPGGTPYFGGVYLDSGTFTMTGGVIKDCAKYSVVLNENATMNANGGEIYGVVEVGKNSYVTGLDGIAGVTVFRDNFWIYHNSARVDWGIFYGSITNYYDDPIIGLTVTYMNGETIYARQILPSGTLATRPDAPTTTPGYTFGGWYADKDLTQRITEIKLSGSKTVYADWKKREPNEPDAVKNPFADVNAGDWFYRDVLFSYEKGLMSGMDAAAFAPYANTTRAQIAVIFYRMEGSPAVEGENSFTDVVRDSGTAWFYDAVTWAQQNGIMGGYGNSSFAPNDPITREQLAAIFYRYAQYKGYDTTQGGMAIREFDDYESISDYAMGAMAWAVNTGLVKGDSNLLYPKGTATRAEIAALFHRFAENGMK